MDSYKEVHQRFMTGHTGTSFGQLVLLLSSIFASCSLRDAILQWTQLTEAPQGQEHKPKATQRSRLGVRFIIDLTIIVIYSLLNMTLLSSYIVSSFLCVIILSVVLFIAHMQTHKSKHLKHVSSNLHNINLDERKTFVTKFRSIVNLLTALAILAVDFQVFPRKLAKTEEFGYGMMDYGVGFFVISNAIVSPQARGKVNSSSSIGQIKKALVSSIPLLILGLGRLITVKGTDYHEHVTEYGVHWNFFITLAALKVLSTCVLCALPRLKPVITGLLLCIGHQFLLSHGLSDYIVVGADGRGGRTTLIDANREGIFSLPGYISMYMMGIQLGRFLFHERSNLLDWLKAALHLTLGVIGISCFVFGLNANIQMVSRRFANAAYIFSTMSFSCIAILVCLLGEIMKTYSSFYVNPSQRSPNKRTLATGKVNQSVIDEKEKLKKAGGKQTAKDPCLMEAISFNSLLFFLLANVMTGLVNFSMSTIYANTPTAMAVLIAYAFCLCLITTVLHLKDIKTKIW